MSSLNISGKAMTLSADAEEVATFFAKMLDHEYTTKDVFRKNFFKDWRKVRSNSLPRQRGSHFLSHKVRLTPNRK